MRSIINGGITAVKGAIMKFLLSVVGVFLVTISSYLYILKTHANEIIYLECFIPGTDLKLYYEIDTQEERLKVKTYDLISGQFMGTAISYDYTKEGNDNISILYDYGADVINLGTNKLKIKASYTGAQWSYTQCSREGD